MNRKIITILIIFVAVAGLIFLTQKPKESIDTPIVADLKEDKVISGSFHQSKLKTEQEWKKILTPKQYHILREAGTEIPFTGALDGEKRKGTYYSIGCNTPVFRSEQKYDSKTGWPSFWDPIGIDAVVLRLESGFGEQRVEVLDKCGGHLGHVFDDGPPPTNKRYCMNSEALKFIPDEE